MINPAFNVRDFSTCLLTATADCDSVLELGCGMGDKIAMTQCKVRHAVDAHPPYVELAKERWGHRIHALHCADAREFIRSVDWYDAILLIDFLEHLEKEDGLVLLKDCKRKARRRIVLFCPEGFAPRDKDVYEMGGDYWQTHRSGWTSEELKAKRFQVAIWDAFHDSGANALFAIWEPK